MHFENSSSESTPFVPVPAGPGQSASVFTEAARSGSVPEEAAQSGAARPQDDPGYRARHAQKPLARKAAREKAAQEAAAAQLREDEFYMRKALAEARKAGRLGEVPIGCVIVKDGGILSRGYNRRNADHSALSHAETNAIRKACRKLSDWRLDDCTLYVTLEPCPMCAGAIEESRIKRVVIGALSPKSGSGGSRLNILSNPALKHRCVVTTGVLEGACSAVLSAFFKSLRGSRETPGEPAGEDGSVRRPVSNAGETTLR